jgi:polar amino acid transport system substrate-binding protein
MRRVGTLIAAVLAAAALAACGSVSDREQRIALAALNTPPPSLAPSTSAGPVSRCTGRTPSVAGSYMAQIKRRRYLVAGVDQNTLLFAYLDPRTVQLQGLEIDLLRQVAKAIFGSPAIRFKALTTDERIPAVQNCDVDLVADAVTITPDREKQVDFSTVYYNAGQRLLVPLDSPIHGLRDLAGRRVCATKSSTSLKTLERLAPRAIPYTVPQRIDCLVALQQGLVDAITSDDSILLGFKAQDPLTQLVGARLAPEPYGVAISKTHPDFVSFVNGVIAQMRKNGTWAAIYKRWLGKVQGTLPPGAAG